MDELEEILSTPDDNDICYFVEVDLKYPDNTKEKTKHFPFFPEIKKTNPEKYSEYLKKIKPKNYITSRKLTCDWADEKNYLIPYRMLKFYIRHGMVIDKVHEVKLFKQSKRLKKFISFNTQKRNRAKNDFEINFFQLLVKAAFGKLIKMFVID